MQTPVKKRKTGKFAVSDLDILSFRSFMKHHYKAMLIFLVALAVFFPYSRRDVLYMYPQAGEISAELIIAPFPFDVMKTDAEIQAERDRVAQRILPTFRYAYSAFSTMEARIDSVIDLAKNYKNNEVLPISRVFLQNPQILVDFREIALASAQRGILNRIVAISPQNGEVLQREYNTREAFISSPRGFIEIVSGEGDELQVRTVPIDSVENIHAFYFRMANYLGTRYNVQSRELSAAMLALAQRVGLPTLIYDQEYHETRLENMFAAINPVKRTIMRDVAIIRPHELVTEDAARALEALRYEQVGRAQEANRIKPIVDTAIIFLLLAALVVIVVFHSGTYAPQFLNREKFFLAVSIICAIQLALIRLTQTAARTLYEHNAGIQMADGRIDLIVSWGPIFTAVILSSLLFGKRIGFLLSLFFTVYMLFITQFSIPISLSILFVGGFVAYFAQKIRYRKHLLTLIIFMVVANILAQLMLNYICNTLSSQTLFSVILAPSLSVLLSVGIVYLVLPLFEYMFGITTITSLLELADLSNPLLKRLAIEAPGTFNHSLAVGNLAELGAEAAGVSPILCRVLAYYHDIGKIKNPIFFTENQLDKKNPHDKLTPLRSAKILINHIKDGCELLDDYRIPKVIKNGVIQHHGTGMAGFFYQKALETKKENEEVLLEDFSYTGEKPQTKETAILMLADKVEAMSKSLKGESESDLRKKIHDNVRKIVISGQLDECGLTFREVVDIVNSFMPALKGIFHERIEYPEEGKNGKEQV